MLVESNKTLVQGAVCPACGHCVAVDFFLGGNQPLATLAWPRTRDEAQALTRHSVNFVRCVYCGHIYNPFFCYENVPYSKKPNLMFNKGRSWSCFIHNVQKKIVSFIPNKATIIEIGHGDGSFLYGLSKLLPDAEFIGFDPHGACNPPGCISLRDELFLPEKHLSEIKPDLIISRHVLEHLVSPVGFLEKIAFYVSNLNLNLLAYFEVPCVDNMIIDGRTVDLYYEHSSQFTTKSFTNMVSRCGANVLEVGHGYDNEVIYSFVRMGNTETKSIVQEAISFQQNALKAMVVIQEQLDKLAKSGQSVAIWGGTGKSAAFMNRYNCDAERFPLVVDSDPAKVGTYVPGTGQQIRFRNYLIDHYAHTIIIPPQWRAEDILQEMKFYNIQFETILIEKKSHLVNYFTGNIF